MKLTKEQVISEHRKMWNWIADKIEEREKSQEIAELKAKYCEENGFILRHNCFCCEYAESNCNYCPVEWDSGLEDCMCEQKCECNDDEGLYARCCLVEDLEEQVKLARQIANLPERECM